MAKITLYQKPTCTTCRQVFQVLKDSRVDFDSVNYYTDPLSKAKLKDLLAKMGIPAAELLRKKEPVYKELGLDKKTPSEAELIDLMAKHPDLIQRPIAEKGAKAVLARPAEKIKEIL